MLKHEKMQTLG